MLPNNTKTLEYTINELEKLVQELDVEFQAPSCIPQAEYFIFRHDSTQRTDILASYLKAVRIVSLLNAAICLIEKGFVQEVYILCRSIDEACEDITFLALSLGETGTSKDQKALIKELGLSYTN